MLAVSNFLPRQEQHFHPKKKSSYIDARNAQDVHVEPVLVRGRILQQVPVRQLHGVAVPFGQVGGAAVQVGDVRLAGAYGVVGVAGDGVGFGLERGDIAGGKGDETVGFVVDVIFEVEVVLLGRGVRWLRMGGEKGGVRLELAHNGIFLVDWEAFFVAVAGAEGTEAVVEELGDEVLVRRSVPEGVNEGGAEGD